MARAESKMICPLRSAMSDLSNEVRDLIKTSYPDIANATLRERDENGLHVVEFLPQSGRKG